MSERNERRTGPRDRRAPVKMTVAELIKHPSMQAWFDRVKALNGEVLIQDNRITLRSRYIPRFVLVTFSERIKDFDTENLLIVEIDDGE